MDISATSQNVADPRAVADIDVTRPTLSFEAFYGDHAQSVARALAVTLNDHELAADAMNEAMTRAYQRWSKIGGYDNPAAWVYRVALNWSLSWKRRRRRERDRPIRLIADQVESTVRDDSLDEALEALSIEHRSVIVCRIHLDWSVEQTAVALGIAAGTVKSRLARGLSQLKHAVEAAEGALP